MISNPPIAVIGLLLKQQVAAQHFPTQEEQAAFQEAVDEYQIFVVPHCAPDEASALYHRQIRTRPCFHSIATQDGLGGRLQAGRR